MDYNTLVKYYPGYQGWNPDAALRDFAATKGEGKRDSSSVGLTPEGTPFFNFNTERAANQAYGELGAYYDRILKESQGDMTKVLARLTEDYQRGTRIKFENTQNNALARGLYQKSAYDTNTLPATPAAPNLGGFGLPEANYKQSIEPLTIAKQRQEIDLPEAQRRSEFDMEQNRRKEAAGIANNRGEKAYQDYLAKFSGY